MSDGSGKRGPRRARDATPAAPRTTANGESTPTAKPSEAGRQQRLHYRRLLRHLGQLARDVTGWDVHDYAARGMNFESYAQSLKDLARDKRAILVDLQAEQWTPALLEKLDREAALAAVKKELPALEALAQSGRQSDHARFAKARRRKKTLLAQDRKERGAR
ncbi:MAG: hypothetical protein M3O50_01875 [Myxococcota bacterium]|nr:hypothetical protein [Myxococcota bacterium]